MGEVERKTIFKSFLSWHVDILGVPFNVAFCVLILVFLGFSMADALWGFSTSWDFGGLWGFGG